MIAKAIVYSDHARGRLRERRITRQNVRSLIATGVRVQTQENAQQYEVYGYLGKRQAMVVMIESARQYFVRTVLWIETKAAQERRKKRT